MATVEEARGILRSLGMPKSQQNEISGMTLLALCGLTPRSSWSDSERRSCTVTKGIMDYLRQHYDKNYAPNTRETVRRQVLHQFVQGRICDRNPFGPDLATNSPHTHYAITKDVLDLIRKYKTDRWDESIRQFRHTRPILQEVYSRERNHNLVPVRLPDDQEIRLSPGRHNDLQRAVVEEFGPQFAPGSELLYLGDTASKSLVVDNDRLDTLSIRITEHDKLPDISYSTEVEIGYSL